MEDLVKLLRNSNLKTIEKETGIPYDRMYKWVKGKATPKTNDYTILLKYFNNIQSNAGNTSNTGGSSDGNKNITQEENNKLSGNKLAPNNTERPRLEAVPIGLHPHEDDDETGTAKFIYAPDGTMGMRVRIVPAKAQAGYLLGYADPEYYDDFDYEIMPVDNEHKGTYLGFEVRGDSMMTTDPELMENNIYPGWRAIGRDLPRQKWAYKLHTHNYDNWIIVHKTKGILIKTIIKHDVPNGIITIHSLNPDYEDEELQLDEIEQIFSVIQIIPKKKR